MGMYAVSAVLGVPAALRLALWGSWRTPFFATAAFAVVVAALVAIQLPSMTAHRQRTSAAPPARPSLGGLNGSKSLAMIGMSATMLSTFLVIPNLSTYVQLNAGFPRQHLELLVTWTSSWRSSSE